MTFTPPDWIGFIVYVSIILTYSWLVERSPWSRNTLSRTMAKSRKAWFEECIGREMRVVDGQIMILQQNGTAYFGSASLLGIGAGFTLLSASSALTSNLIEVPFFHSEGLALKALILMLVFALAFFQFSWAFRLFVYNSILLGAIPQDSEGRLEQARAMAHRAAAINLVAGQHFNQAMRLFLFAIPLIFWLVNLWAFLGATLLLTLIMIRRQFLTVPQLDGIALAWNMEEKR